MTLKGGNLGLTLPTANPDQGHQLRRRLSIRPFWLRDAVGYLGPTHAGFTIIFEPAVSKIIRPPDCGLSIRFRLDSNRSQAVEAREGNWRQYAVLCIETSRNTDCL